MKSYQECIKIVLMRLKMRKYFKEFFGFIVIMVIVVNFVSFYRSLDIQVNDEICQDGSDIVYFWGIWCPVCKMESSNIDLLNHYYKVKTIVVSSGDTEKIQKYLDRHHLSFSFINDKNAQIAHKHGIVIFPTIITCKKKKVYYSDVGYTSVFGLLLRLWL